MDSRYIQCEWYVLRVHLSFLSEQIYVCYITWYTPFHVSTSTLVWGHISGRGIVEYTYVVWKIRDRLRCILVVLSRSGGACAHQGQTVMELLQIFVLMPRVIAWRITAIFTVDSVCPNSSKRNIQMSQIIRFGCLLHCRYASLYQLCCRSDNWGFFASVIGHRSRDVYKWYCFVRKTQWICRLTPSGSQSSLNNPIVLCLLCNNTA